MIAPAASGFEIIYSKTFHHTVLLAYSSPYALKLKQRPKLLQILMFYNLREINL
jgi:hypothetical protein